MKEKLLNLLRERDTVEEQEFNIQNIINQSEAVDIIQRYEEIIKTGNKKETISYEAIQGQMLKKIKDKEGFIENVGLSRSTVYFKIVLYKCLKKFLAKKNSS